MPQFKEITVYVQPKSITFNAAEGAQVVNLTDGEIDDLGAKGQVVVAIEMQNERRVFVGVPYEITYSTVDEKPSIRTGNRPIGGIVHSR